MARAYRLRGRADDAEGALGAALWDAGCEGVQIDDGDLVAVFASERDGMPPGGAWEDVDARDHVAAYLEGLRPVRVGRLVVAPSHRLVCLREGQTVLWLDPGMAFGTGHHETTRLALAALAAPARDLRGLRVLDVGAGSGVLAIAADRLGAAEARGIDVDPESVPIARANADRNRSRARFELGEFGADSAPVGSVDLLLANLYAELHVRFLGAYARLLAPGGRALLTGIVAGREALVREAVRAPLRLEGEQREGEWWLLELAREPGPAPAAEVEAAVPVAAGADR